MTLDELAAKVDALQTRVAYLELRCGSANDTTLADLPDGEVMSAIGGGAIDSKELARLRASWGVLDLPTGD